VHLIHLQIIIRIVSLKRSTLAGYILQLKSRLQIKLKDGIKGVVIATFKRGIKGGQLMSYVSYKMITLTANYPHSRVFYWYIWYIRVSFGNY
jgi:hypothetical protein